MDNFVLHAVEVGGIIDRNKMTKLIQLALSKIKYTGDSIGDDIRIEIDCLNHSVDVNKKIQSGSEVPVNVPVGSFFTDQLSFSLPLSVRVIERDLIFNDFGSIEAAFSVDTRVSTAQSFTAKVEVHEKRNYESKKKAVFELILGAQVTDAIAYVKYDKMGDGWLVVVPKIGEENIGIPYHLKVRLDKQDSGRQYFEVLEGPRRGEHASVEMAQGGVSRFQQENPHAAPVHFVYSLFTKKLKFGKKTYLVRDYPSDPVPEGLHDIEIADSSHKGGIPYLDRARLAKVWFRVGHTGERYVHAGGSSLGCVTLTEIERWDELCNILLAARKGDGLSVGILQVVA